MRTRTLNMKKDKKVLFSTILKLWGMGLMLGSGIIMAFSHVPPALAGSEPTENILSQPNTVPGIPAMEMPSQSGTENSQELGGETSLNFMAAHPLTPPATRPENLTTDKTKTVIHFLTGIDMDRLEHPADDTKDPFDGVEHPVSILVYEKGIKSGDADNGSSNFEWRYSSGFKSSMVNTHALHGDEKTSHTVLLETNLEESWKAERDIQYTSRLDQGNIVSESYDIRYDLKAEGKPSQNADHVITREVLRYVYAYRQGEKHLKSMSWTKYQDRLNAAPREVELHAVLVYDDQGRPKQGYADKWNEGRKTRNLFDWRSEKSTLNFETRELWTLWEKWVKNGPAHVFIV